MIEKFTCENNIMIENEKPRSFPLSIKELILLNFDRDLLDFIDHDELFAFRLVNKMFLEDSDERFIFDLLAKMQGKNNNDFIKTISLKNLRKLIEIYKKQKKISQKNLSLFSYLNKQQVKILNSLTLEDCREFICKYASSSTMVGLEALRLQQEILTPISMKTDSYIWKYMLSRKQIDFLIHFKENK